MVAKHTLTRALDQLLTETEAQHRRALAEEVAKRATELKDLKTQLVAAQRANGVLRKQRDRMKGIVAEYKGYANKYQRELVAARNEIKQLLKGQQ